MVATASTMLALGTVAPAFTLFDTVSQKVLSLEVLKSDKATVIMFICNHCPYVVHLLDKLLEVAASYQKKGIAFIAISANDVSTHPADAPDKMAMLAKEKQFSFPYLYDETQEVAKNYDAACTPDFYIFDNALQCVYRGQFDDSRPGSNTPVTGRDLCHALDNILLNQPVDPHQQPSLGCNIKWRV